EMDRGGPPPGGGSRAPAPAHRRPGPGVAAGHQSSPGVSGELPVVLVLALALTLGVELYYGVTALAVFGGHWLLAFGLSLDAASRALGAIAAHRAASPSGAWRCVLIGSPAAAAFTLLGDRGPVQIDPAPLAGFVSVAAMGAVVLSLLGMVVGI
ncbi:MAG: hypothetical protein M3Z27_03100, partial [Actinomycetota bacterium]|nr:hypothetical protein [Actinomycetota bacterium]